MRVGSSEHSQRTDDTRPGERKTGEERPRKPADPVEIERFRTLLAQRHLHERPRVEPLEAVQRYGSDDPLRAEPGTTAMTTGRDALPQADAVALQQAQRAAVDMPAQAASAHLTSAAFSELLERHVRQLLASDSAARSSDGRVMLRLSEATLPGTDLTLERTPDGWRLRADVSSRTSFEAIREYAPSLVERFAQRHLGTLEIDPVLSEQHGA